MDKTFSVLIDSKKLFHNIYIEYTAVDNCIRPLIKSASDRKYEAEFTLLLFTSNYSPLFNYIFTC